MEIQQSMDLESIFLAFEEAGEHLIVPEPPLLRPLEISLQELLEISDFSLEMDPELEEAEVRSERSLKNKKIHKSQNRKNRKISKITMADEKILPSTL